MKKCPACAEEIQDEAVKCKHCQTDLKKLAVKKRGDSQAKGCCVGCLGLFLMMLFMGGGGGGKPRSDAHLLTSGSHAIVTRDLLMPVDKKAQEALQRASRAGDKTGLGNLVASGKVIPVKSGSKVLILGTSFGTTDEVRVVEGPQAGKAGLVVTSDMRKP